MVSGNSTSSPVVVLNAPNVTDLGSPASYIGMHAATVPDTSISSPRGVWDAQRFLRGTGGLVDTGRPGFRSHRYASFGGGFKLLSVGVSS